MILKNSAVGRFTIATLFAACYVVFPHAALANSIGEIRQDADLSGAVTPGARFERYNFSISQRGCFNFENLSDGTSVFGNLTTEDGKSVNGNMLLYDQSHGRKVIKIFLAANDYVLDIRYMARHLGGIYRIRIWRTDC